MRLHFLETRCAGQSCTAILTTTPSEPIPAPPYRIFSNAHAGGGIARPRKQETAAEADAEPLAPEGQEDYADREQVAQREKAATELVILRNPKWEAEAVGFNEETGISVEADLPASQAHKTKVEFELFAMTPVGLESISKSQAHLESGRAVCKIPVYIPQYQDETGRHLNTVEYHFTAKHSLSDLLNARTTVKVVDRMATRLIESHILEDITFATGNSQIRASQAGALKSLVDRIRAWKTQHPEGKLAVFGHADAVGKEDANKQLSERRARAVQAFLTKDAAAWEDLAKVERWDRSAEPDAKTFMADHNILSLTDKDFESVDGKPFAGCSEFNRVEETPGANEKNRRVAVLLLKSSRNFPIQYPCKQGDIALCRKQMARKMVLGPNGSAVGKGERRTPGFSCCFYDGLVQEQAGSGGAGASRILDVHFENESGEKVAVTRAGKKVRVVLKSEHLVGQKVDIHLGDVPFAIEYQGRLLDKGILEGIDVTADILKVEFIPRRRSGKHSEGGNHG